MSEYYGKISVNSVCLSTKYVSAIHGDGDARSNDIGIAREITKSLPELVDRANFYTYDLQRRR